MNGSRLKQKPRQGGVFYAAEQSAEARASNTFSE